MTKWILAAALIFSAFPSSAIAKSKGDLIGTWKLLSSKDKNEKGEVKDSYSQNPTGFLTYTADGRMMAIISNAGRKPLSVPDWISAPAEERAEAFATSVAYAGRYTFSGDRVIHHVEASSLQNFVGTDFVRFITKVDRDRLILRVPPLLKGGERVTQELVWERMKPTR
jgi:Lipocalin-like domain